METECIFGGRRTYFVGLELISVWYCILTCICCLLDMNHSGKRRPTSIDDSSGRSNKNPKFGDDSNVFDFGTARASSSFVGEGFDFGNRPTAGSGAGPSSRTRCEGVGLVDGGSPSIFLYMKCNDDDIKLSKISPFTICKAIDGICGSVQQVKPLKNGQLLIKVNDKSQADKLLRCTNLVNNQYQITVSMASRLNSTQGVIYADELRCVSDSVLLKNFEQFGVYKVQRLNKGPDKTPTALLVLTFNKPQLPFDIAAGYLNYRIRPYYPRPFQCFKCFKFSHGQNECRVVASICRHCGESGHLFSDCEKLAKCANCSLDHGATDKDCPKYKDEVNIIKMKVDQRITMAEAKRLYNASSGRTYTGATAVTSVGAVPNATVAGPGKTVLINQATPDKDNSIRVWCLVKEVFKIFEDDLNMKSKISLLSKLINKTGVAVGADIVHVLDSDGAFIFGV